MLLGLRDFQDTKADVILKYTADEARMLKSYGEIPDNIKINETAIGMEEGDDEDGMYRAFPGCRLSSCCKWVSDWSSSFQQPYYQPHRWC